ncbi:MAG TPA: HEAT repeat domain-containing protein [Anaerolineales bacterium]|nr:HEAT repeat domain-containing protein [Anaerolineales bacterium]
MSSLPHLLSELTSGNDERAQQAVRELKILGSKAIPHLVELASASETDARWWAICALAEIDHPGVFPHLRHALADPDASVRECAAMGLRLHPNPVAIPDLIGAMKTPNLLLMRLAANALVAIGKEAVPALLDVMESAPQAARVEATRALAEIKDTRCIPVFFSAIQNGDSPLVEYWADQGLEKLGVGMTFFNPG